MNKVKSLSHYFPVVGISLYAILLGIIITLEPQIGLIFALLPILVLVTLQYQYTLIALLLIVLPLHASPYLAQNIMGITGMKPFNLVAFSALFFLFIREGNLLHFKDPLEKKTLSILFVYFLFFSLAFFRSLQNFSLFHTLLPEFFPNSKLNYIFSYYIQRSLYLVAFLFILKTVRKENEIKEIVSIIAGSLFFLSCAIIIIVGIHLGEFFQGRHVSEELCRKYLGMHYNGVGNIYVVCGPILLFKALGKNRFWLANFFLAILAILLLQSRTALFTFCGSIFILLLLLNKTRFIFIFGGGIFLFTLLWLPEALINSFISGFDKGSVDEVLSGRISNIWIPLLREWFESPEKLFFGAGSFSMLTSSLWTRGLIVQSIHAHNAFIDFFLDNGFILLLLFIYYILTYMIAAWRKCQQINNSLCWALFVTLLAYLVSSMTERQFYPNADGMFLYPFIALLINLIRLHLYGNQSLQTKSYTDVAP